jgi:hypothetical protein
MTNYHATSEGNIPFTEEEEIEWAAEKAKFAQEAPKILNKSKISLLESAITPRRTREAILGVDNGWLANQETAIAALRAQL